MHIKVRSWVKIIIILIILFVSFFMYSRYIGTTGLLTKEYTIVNSKLPNSFYGFKIVHISDIHYKTTTSKESLKKLVKEVNLLKPDIVILSGDLFDKSIKYNDSDYKNLKSILNSINYNIGKYAIKGDSDTNKNWESIINDSDFVNLNDGYKYIYYEGMDPILLMGISSNYDNNHINNTLNSLYKETKKEYKYSILVVHEPDFIESIDYSKFNLILGGHSLNGQINIPFIGRLLKQKYSNIYYDNFYDLGNTKVYISSGLGTSRYKYRLFNKPSINLYRLRNK